MKIRYLLLHAYGMGGTIRTVFTQANALAAAGHDVRVVSAVRRADRPYFPLDPRVRLTALADLRPGTEPPARRRGLAGRLRARHETWLAGRPPRHVPEGESGRAAISRALERTLIAYLGQLTDGVLVTTRPSLNLLSARFATRGVVRVAQEHMNLHVHQPDVRAAIARWYPRVEAIGVLTRQDEDDYREAAPGARVVRIPNAVHSLRQKPSSCAQHVVVAAGRLRPQKGFDLLIPAFGRLVDEFPDWQLRIYGTGDRKRQLRRLVEEHHLYNHVLLMGRSDRLDDELAKASVYVLSSRAEGLPMVMLEAMSHGLPVVSFDCPTGPGEVLTHGRDGLLVPTGDTEGLTDALRRLMADEALRARMGDAALATVREYAPEVVGRRWADLFTELLAGARAAEPAPPVIGRTGPAYGR
ncbi:glycosyltransferase family 4 protein [Streptomyces sp. RFCAC02]|uniref:glycosyltransferase family 4 protein n=1 Tax=Streptomyces sp. RFCAC02 TaxID=2499143 RepID=UPI00101E918B|nr:glycosyltransferase family 4 protein [Streptomyces sp. RFCAC02]